MPTTDSRVKLREASYFLAGMRQRNGSERLDLGEEFGYFLSAFLSAARSISFVLRKENANTYAQLRDTWLASLDPMSLQLCEEMKEHRNVALKEGALPTSSAVRYVPWLSVAGNRSHPYRLIQPWMRDSGAQVGLAFFQLETPQGTEDAVAACSRYLGHLDRLVALFDASATT